MTDDLRRGLASANPERLQEAMVQLWRMLSPHVGALIDSLLPDEDQAHEAEELKEEVVRMLFQNRGRITAAEDLRQAAVRLSVEEIHWHFFYREELEETAWGER